MLHDPIMPHHSPKVLIIAPNASSEFGGEAYIPLQYFRILRGRGCPAKMITHARNRANLKIAAAPYFEDIVFIEDIWAHRFLHRCSERFPKAIGDIIFGSLMAALDSVLRTRAVRKMIEVEKPEIIHQPTPVSPLAPTGLHRFGLPLVVGPMNGGMNYPEGYSDLEGSGTRRFVRWSRRVAWLANRVIAGKRRAAVLLVANQRTREALPFREHRNIQMLVENGVDAPTWKVDARPEPSSPREDADTLRLVYMGRLVDWKMVDISLDAVRRSLDRGARVGFDVIGDGPERGRLERLAAELGIANSVRFRGFLPQRTCARILASSDALILNSVWECGGAVVLEAMAARLPVIASDWGGPSDYLDADCGILVSPVPRSDFAARLSDAILHLARSPDIRVRMGAAGARKVAEHYDWQRKVDTMIGVYAGVLGSPAREILPAPH